MVASCITRSAIDPGSRIIPWRNVPSQSAGSEAPWLSPIVIHARGFLNTRNYSINIAAAAAAKVSRCRAQDKASSTRKTGPEVCIRDREERACGWRLEGSPGCVESETQGLMHRVAVRVHVHTYGRRIAVLAVLDALDHRFGSVSISVGWKRDREQARAANERCETSTRAPTLCNTIILALLSNVDTSSLLGWTFLCFATLLSCLLSEWRAFLNGRSCNNSTMESNYSSGIPRIVCVSDGNRDFPKLLRRCFALASEPPVLAVKNKECMNYGQDAIHYSEELFSNNNFRPANSAARCKRVWIYCILRSFDFRSPETSARHFGPVPREVLLEQLHENLANASLTAWSVARSRSGQRKLEQKWSRVFLEDERPKERVTYPKGRSPVPLLVPNIHTQAWLGREDFRWWFLFFPSSLLSSLRSSWFEKYIIRIWLELFSFRLYTKSTLVMLEKVQSLRRWWY